MNALKISALLLAVHLTRSFFVNLPVSGSSPVKLTIDFGFPAILISEADFTCSESTKCKYNDQGYQRGVYRGSNYDFRHATITLEASSQSFDLLVQINVSKLNTFGLSPKAEYAPAFEGKSGLTIDLTTGSVINTALSYNTAFDFSFDQTYDGFYIAAILKYELEVQELNPVVQNPTRLCLQQDSPTSSANYFFLSDRAFAQDWDGYLEQIYFISFVAKKLEYKVLLGVDGQQPSSIDYDSKIFESYDRQPFKTVSDQSLKGFCELYAGDFFAQRAGLAITLSKQAGQADLSVSGNVNQQDYEVYFSINWRYLLNLVLWLSALVMMVLCCCPECTGIKFKEPKPDRLIA